jgi:hypothetical protein
MHLVSLKSYALAERSRGITMLFLRSIHVPAVENIYCANLDRGLLVTSSSLCSCIGLCCFLSLPLVEISYYVSFFSNYDLSGCHFMIVLSHSVTKFVCLAEPSWCDEMFSAMMVRRLMRSAAACQSIDCDMTRTASGFQNAANGSGQ